MVCFDTAGEEYDFSSAYPSSLDLWLGEYKDTANYDQIKTTIAVLDTAAAQLADACVARNSPALMTSSVAYVVRDMAVIVDLLDGAGAPLNFWGFSYGTIYGVEYIQTFPHRVGKVVLDGVYDAAANAKSYDFQLPNDQISVSDAINDFLSFCEQAGSPDCAFAEAPVNITGSLAARFDNIHEDLFRNPIPITDTISIDVGVFSTFLDSFFLVPSTWPVVAAAVAAIEQRDAGPMLQIINSQAAPPPTNRSSPATGLLRANPLQCVDNAPSSHITLDLVTSLLINISLAENTPWLAQDLGPITFCRNFPDTRPKLANLGVTKMAETDAILASRQTPILIANGQHDSSTPLISAQRLRKMLPNSSGIVIRRGPGHTSISLPSLGMAQTIQTYFINGTLPTVDENFHSISLDVFAPGADALSIPRVPVFNGTYTINETALLNATYAVFLGFLGVLN